MVGANGSDGSTTKNPRSKMSKIKVRPGPPIKEYI